KIEEGGVKSMEISDNGIGIDKENLAKAFEAHTTSKISSMEDLNNILTMGFRGEALSTIVSIANVSILSKTNESEFAYQLDFDGITPLEPKKAARENGTTITVANIFEKIPARKKFLKTPDTEYRKIVEILIPYFLIYPNIHWILVKDNKETYNLPKVTDVKGLSIDRIKKVLKQEWIDKSLEFKSNGNGLNTYGYVSHPSNNADKTNHQYIFVNNRPIWDNGIARSVHEAYYRYIPIGRKVPFIINLDIEPRLIDVNVHPRKEEIKFENPYRIYIQLQEAITAALSKAIKSENSQVNENNGLLNDNTQFDYQPTQKPSGSNNTEIRFDKEPKEYSIKSSLEFSKQLLKNKQDNQALQQGLGFLTQDDRSQSNNHIKNAFQIFNKYIVLEFEKDLWVIDQHAAAERINYEKLLKRYNGSRENIQNLLVPVVLELDDIEAIFINENKEFFNNLGINLNLKANKVEITSIPSEFTQSNIEEIFRNILNIEDVKDSKKKIDEYIDDLLATMACHSSIRSGQPLNNQECIQIYKDLMKCDTPYSCPHGRPAIW
ncbi:MAG TPA: DNA mismatch repair endonuclease MutL, partial [Candidatus Dojkabacteria bacterium]|nr:DNA mismatch repair endonuclease MutL [Candidatus Dojkabacteria bacterium]